MIKNNHIIILVFILICKLKRVGYLQIIFYIGTLLFLFIKSEDFNTSISFELKI